MLSNVWSGDYRISQPFGCTDLSVEPFWANCFEKHWHCGIDVALPKGTALYAARPGIVCHRSPGILGIQVDAETDYYIHGVYGGGYVLGAAVAQGEHIGFSSDVVPSGGSLTGPHLHFERQAGRLNFPASSLDPEPILIARFSGGSGSLLGVDDMTPEESAQLNLVTTRVDQIIQLVVAGNDAAVQSDGLTSYEARVIKPELDKLVPPVPPDLSALSAAITALTAKVDAIASSVVAIKAKTDRDLA